MILSHPTALVNICADFFRYVSYYSETNTYTGGTGIDTYQLVWSPSWGASDVTDFAAGAGGDVIDISNIGLSGSVYASNPFLHGYMQVVDDGFGNTLLQIDYDSAGGAYGFQTALKLDDKAIKQLTTDARAILQNVLPSLESSASWDGQALEAVVREFSEQSGTKLGNVAQPIRVALTGRTVSPPVFTVLEVLGRQEALSRLKACLN